MIDFKQSIERGVLIMETSSYCTWFPDRIFGVDISLPCYDHDAAYDTLDYKLKIKGDSMLFHDIWELGNRQRGWRNPALKAVATLMFSAVSTVGNLFWLKGKIKNGYHNSNK